MESKCTEVQKMIFFALRIEARSAGAISDQLIHNTVLI